MSPERFLYEKVDIEESKVDIENKKVDIENEMFSKRK